jgi:alpha-glucoside transport system permease protein
MTAPATSVGRGAARAAWRPAFVRSAPLRVAVIGICLLWSLPTLGLFVTSFRNPRDITISGWWEALLSPFQQGQWSLANYGVVLGSEGMGNAFLNSLIVTIPSTVRSGSPAGGSSSRSSWDCSSCRSRCRSCPS